MTTPNKGAAGSNHFNLPKIPAYRPRLNIDERARPDSDPSLTAIFEHFRLSRKPSSEPNDFKAAEISSSPGPVTLADHLPKIAVLRGSGLTDKLLLKHNRVNPQFSLADKVSLIVEKDPKLSEADKKPLYRVIHEQVRKIQRITSKAVDSVLGNPVKLLQRFGEIKKATESVKSLTAFYNALPKKSITLVTKKHLMIRISGEVQKAVDVLKCDFERSKEGHVPHLSKELYGELRHLVVDIQDFFR